MNPLRGESVLTAGDTIYTLVFDINALCEAEHALGMDTDAMLARYTSGLSMNVVRGLIWAGLQAKHPDIGTVEQAGEIIADAGFLPAKEALEEALKRAMPEAAAEQNPPKKGRAGTKG